MSAGRALALGLALAGCGGAPADDRAGADAVPVDTVLVELLVELHLADARAALDTTAADPAQRADSLRGVALRAHGVGPAALEARLDALGRDPALARATYDAVDAHLTSESFGNALE